MNQYRPMPLIYGANKDMMNTVRFTMEFTEPIQAEVLHRAVEEGMKRYPYFSVKIVRCGENWVLEENDRPFVISSGGKTVCLGSEEANEHLVAFAYEGNSISIDMSHYIADGTGMTPLFQTIAWYYLTELHGEEGFDKSGIRLTGDEILPEEENHPFPKELLSALQEAAPPFEADAFVIPDELFDDKGVYAYHLLVPQKELLAVAKANGGSPASLLTTIMFRVVSGLFPDTEKDFVCGIPHQLRATLGKPLAHDNLITMPFVKITSGMRNLNLKALNKNIRDQLNAATSEAADIQTINGMMQLDAYLDQMPFEMKQQTVRGLVAQSKRPFTFSISYTGNICWGGMEEFIRDVHFYVDENVISQKVECEMYTIGDFFSLTFMQHGKNDLIISALMKELEICGISCIRSGEKRYRLCEFRSDY